jgi:hypothetical protein
MAQRSRGPPRASLNEDNSGLKDTAKLFGLCESKATFGHRKEYLIPLLDQNEDRFVFCKSKEEIPLNPRVSLSTQKTKRLAIELKGSEVVKVRSVAVLAAKLKTHQQPCGRKYRQNYKEWRDRSKDMLRKAHGKSAREHDRPEYRLDHTAIDGTRSPRL